jgi:hypothetical protein
MIVERDIDGEHPEAAGGLSGTKDQVLYFAVNVKKRILFTVHLEVKVGG